MLESAPFTTDCARCRSSIEATVTEAFDGTARWWDLEASCAVCGNTWTDCGYKLSPQGFRDAILAANGPTVLRLEADSASTASVMRVLRLAESLSLAEARAKADELRVAGAQGTLVEMEVLAGLFRTSGAVVRVLPGRGDKPIGHALTVQGIGTREVAAPNRIGQSRWQPFDAVPNSLSDSDAERLLGYLRSAGAVLLAPGTIPDPFGYGHPGKQIPIGLMTDGDWIWSLEWEYYVERYRVALPDEFMKHIETRGWNPPVLADERLLEISRQLGMPDGDEN